jgi:hypothetical protein
MSDTDTNVWACSTHRTGDIVGYEVRLTLDVDGNDLGRYDAPIIGHVDGGNRYAEALDIVRGIQAVSPQWAVIDNVYSCGHTSRDFG